MRINELEIQAAGGIRDSDMLVLEKAGGGTRSISVGEFKTYLLDTLIVPAINQRSNEFIEKISELKTEVVDLKFNEAPVVYMTDINRLGISFMQPHSGMPFRLIITNSATGEEVFRTLVTDPVSTKERIVPYSFRDYGPISALSEVDKAASGLSFDKEQYLWNPRDWDNPLIKAIDDSNDTIIPLNTVLLLEIDSEASGMYDYTAFTVLEEHILYVTKTI